MQHACTKDTKKGYVYKTITVVLNVAAKVIFDLMLVLPFPVWILLNDHSCYMYFQLYE